MKSHWMLGAGLVLTVAGALAGCTGGRAGRPYRIAMDGNPQHGRELIVHYGCGACHVIPGIYTARGLVGPPLFFWSRRTIIAGELPNNPENLMRWIENPPAVEPGTAMPNLGVTPDQARDMAAYLYTLQ
jgi:cytochrome c